ncbi:PilT/PilU family type 4a pilus ATPase [bacterium]|nr:PilT/PilU family type 4a pilus ATPase [Candidatus Elulimicrobium humile]
MQINLIPIINQIITTKGSDIHLTTGSKPILRVKNRLIQIEEAAILTKESIDELLATMISKEKMDELYAGQEQDFAYTFDEVNTRFRVNVFIARGYPNVVMRYLPSEILTFEQLGLPSVMHQFSKLIQGFVLVTGPTGSGKSTTLASIINEINHTRDVKIVTIEDPIEFVYRPDRSIITQREVGYDTKSFSNALESSFRQDIDVILLGEMRDLDTMRVAVTAAETGHLVFSTLHTNSASQSIDRIIDTFPTHQQGQVKSQIANSIQAIVAQRLIPTVNGELTPALEILLTNNAVRSLIRENRIYQIDTVIETNRKEGMISMNFSLFDLVSRGIVSYETALLYSPDPISLRNMFNRSRS